MHRSGSSCGKRTSAIIASAVLGASLATGVIAATATASAAQKSAKAAAIGTVLGGLSAQRWPVVVELSRSGRQVVRAAAGLHLTCTAGGVMNVPDFYEKLSVSRSGRFGTSFGPLTQREDDGTTLDVEGSLSGRVNKARTRASGTWHVKLTHHDASGAVDDTCDSGTVRWSAKA